MNSVEVKLVWQILGPPGIFMTSNVVAHLYISIWGPILRAIWKNRGSANQPKMDQIENFSIIYCTKSKLKGGQFNENKTGIDRFQDC